MNGLTPQQKVLILRLLRDAHGPMGSARIARELEAFGFELSPRTIRLYLEALEQAGLVAQAKRGRGGGRTITPRGLDEIDDALVFDRVGLTAAKVDTLAWNMSFDLGTKSGLIVLNLSTIAESELSAAMAEMAPVFEAGLGMGEYLVLFHAGELVGGLPVPPGKIGIGTVCSVTINGILLNTRVPTVSRFGGVLELEDGQPARFTDVIYYDGTSLDPLEIFIKGGLTRVREAAQTGRGRIGASFREVPSDAVGEVEESLRQAGEAGLGGTLMIGKPNQPLLGFPVPEGRTGLLVTGGLNPVAAVEEAGISTENFALCQLFEFERLQPYRTLAAELGIGLD